MMKTTRIEIRSCAEEQGDLYEVMGEDGPLYCYDYTFVATGWDGAEYRSHHVVRGAVMSPDGFKVANYDARRQAARFVERVDARRSIDPALWDRFEREPYNLEAVWAAEAEREHCERHGLPF